VSPLGIAGLFGGATEWMLDDAAPFAGAAWEDSRLVDPRIEDSNAGPVYRGSCWMCSSWRPTFRFTSRDREASPSVGVRCAYPVASP
jgi:formylglycine-generating enzyme required for sulfatase activity